MNNQKITIDFFTLILIIKKYFLLICLFPISSVAICYLINQNSIPNYIASTTIKSLNNSDKVMFSVYNKTISNLQRNQVLNDAIERIDKYFLFGENKVSIKALHKEPLPEIQQLLTSKLILENITKALPDDFVKDIELIPNLSDEDSNYQLLVSVQGSSKDIKNVLEENIEGAINAVVKEYNVFLQKTTDVFIRNKDIFLSKLSVENSMQIDLFKYLIDSRIKFLMEQSSIAHSLNLATPPGPDYIMPNLDSGNTLEYATKMYPEYLRGYEALDEEIKALTSREDYKDLIVDYKMNSELIKIINHDSENILNDLKNIGWFNENLILVNYNSDDITVSTIYDKIRNIHIAMTALISIGFGILISTVIFILRNN